FVELVKIYKTLSIESEFCFGGEHSAYGFVDARLFYLTRLDRFLQRTKCLLDAWRIQHHVGAGCDSAHRRLAFRLMRRYATHGHRVGEDHAPELKFVAQYAAEHLRQERRR